MNAADPTSPPPLPSSQQKRPRVSETVEGSISLVDQRFAGLDMLRFVAAVLIVYLHTTGATSLQYTNRATRIAVPFFTASAAFLAYLTGRKGRRSLAKYSRTRVIRVYVPFLAWVLIYYLVAIAGSFVKGGSVPTVDWRWLIHGNAHHLWFLPFICMTSIAVFAVARWLPSRPILARLVAVGLLVLGGITAVWPAPAWINAMGYLAFLSYDTSPAVFWIVSMLLWLDASGQMSLPRACVGWLAWVPLMVCVALQSIYGRIDALENMAGVLLFLVGLDRLPGQNWRGWLTLSGWAYGVYLAHVLFVETLQDVVTMLGFTETGVVTLAIFIASLTGSLALCAVLSRWRFSRYLGIDLVPMKQPGLGQPLASSS